MHGVYACTERIILMAILPNTWWRHQMEIFSALLALCAGNSRVTGEFPSQRPVTHSFDVFFDLHLNNRFSKQSRRQWFETPSRPLWRHCDVTMWFVYRCPSWNSPRTRDQACRHSYSTCPVSQKVFDLLVWIPPMKCNDILSNKIMRSKFVNTIHLMIAHP